MYTKRKSIIMLTSVMLVCSQSSLAAGQAGESARTRLFEPPQLKRLGQGVFGVANCLSNGSDCGEIAADAFCRAKRAGWASDFEVDEDSRKRTIYADTRKICDGDGCEPFEYIECAR